MKCEENNILEKYLEDIKNAPDILVTETVLEQQNFSTDEDPVKNKIRDIKSRKESLRDKLDHYEKLYRCFIEARRVGREKLTVIAVTIAATVVLVATIFCCAFGPNFKSQESEDTSSTTETVMVNGYAGRGSYGYTYFQESENGRK